jgi:hypothetical protein
MSTVPFIFAGNTGNIPLSQLDADFANVKLSVDFVIQNTQANINTVGTLTNLSVAGNVLAGGIASVAGNVTVGGTANLVGNITTAGSISSAGLITATGNITGGNIRTAGLITAGGNIITTGNILTAGLISAGANVTCNVLIANTVTAPLLNSANVSLTGNLTVAGNAQVNGTTTFINTQNLNITDKNITIANNASTSALIDGAGIDAGSPTVAYIRYSNASQGWTTANTFSIGSNLSVTGTTTLSGAATAPTVANGTSNTQIATTSFVSSTIINLGLGTMSTQNANNVSITGGNITGITALLANAGGTGLSSLTANAVLVGNGTGTVKTVSPGTSGNVLTSDGTNWSSSCALIGVNQTWQNLSGSRGTDVTYTNTTGRPIQVLVTLVNTGGAWMYINGNLVIRQFYDVNTGAGQVGYSFVTAIIPAESTYLVTAGGLSTWYELR